MWAFFASSSFMASVYFLLSSSSWRQKEKFIFTKERNTHSHTFTLEGCVQGHPPDRCLCLFPSHSGTSTRAARLQRRKIWDARLFQVRWTPAVWCDVWKAAAGLWNYIPYQRAADRSHDWSGLPHKWAEHQSPEPRSTLSTLCLPLRDSSRFTQTNKIWKHSQLSCVCVCVCFLPSLWVIVQCD